MKEAAGRGPGEASIDGYDDVLMPDEDRAHLWPVYFLLLSGIVSLFFMLFPGIDLMISRWFYVVGQGFVLSKNRILVDLREFNLALPYYLCAAAVALLVAQRLRPFPALPRPSALAFFIVYTAIGPGLIVQIVKGLIGRARPRDLVEFGGVSPFTVPWQISENCTSNCSFLSGEGATGAALLALPLLLPPGWRRLGYAVVAPFAVFVSLNRVAFGAHFISDVTIAWLIMLSLMTFLWPLFMDRADRFDRLLTGRP